VHLKALAVRREIAAASSVGSSAQPELRDARRDVARSLLSAGRLHEGHGGHARRPEVIRRSTGPDGRRGPFALTPLEGDA
jgi:hypothetical protein